MTQGALFDDVLSLANEVVAPRRGRVRATDPDTSQAAARRVKAGSQTHNVLIVLGQSPNGATQEELWLAGGSTRATGRFPNHAQTRAEDLRRLGLAAATGARRENAAGNPEQVWVATDLGRLVLAELAGVAA